MNPKKPPQRIRNESTAAALYPPCAPSEGPQNADMASTTTMISGSTQVM